MNLKIYPRIHVAEQLSSPKLKSNSIVPAIRLLETADSFRSLPDSSIRSKLESSVGLFLREKIETTTSIENGISRGKEFVVDSGDSVKTTETSDEASLFGLSENGDIIDIFGVPSAGIFDHGSSDRRKLVREILMNHKVQLKNIFQKSVSKLQRLRGTVIASKLTFKLHHRTKKLMCDPPELLLDSTHDRNTIISILRNTSVKICRVDVGLKEVRSLYVFGERQIKVKATTLEGKRRVKYKLYM